MLIRAKCTNCGAKHKATDGNDKGTQRYKYYKNLTVTVEVCPKCNKELKAKMGKYTSPLLMVPIPDKLKGVLV